VSWNDRRIGHDVRGRTEYLPAGLYGKAHLQFAFTFHRRAIILERSVISHVRSDDQPPDLHGRRRRRSITSLIGRRQPPSSLCLSYYSIVCPTSWRAGPSVWGRLVGSFFSPVGWPREWFIYVVYIQFTHWTFMHLRFPFKNACSLPIDMCVHHADYHVQLWLFFVCVALSSLFDYQKTF
jgi:hypothetical protein